MTPRFLASPLAAALVVAAALLGGAAVLSPRPSTVGTVNLEKVFNTINLQAIREADLKAMVTRMKAREVELEKAVKDLESELDSFQPGSKSAIEAQNKVQAAVGEFRAYGQYSRLKLEAEEARFMRETYLAIREAAGRYARQNGIDVVLLDDSIPEFQTGTADRTVQQISNRRVLFANPELDLSDALIAFMNAEGSAAPDPNAAAPVAVGP
jgi:Skp family chaperone for outer membrane proteins